MTPKEPSEPDWKVVCPIHGDLTPGEQINDHVAADLVRREHREQCPDDPEIVNAGGFTTAAKLLEQQDSRSPGQEGYWASLDDAAEEGACASCGGDPDVACSACGATAGEGEA